MTTVGLRNHHNKEVLCYHCLAQDRHIKAIPSPGGIPVPDYNYKCSFTIENHGDKVALRSGWIGIYLAAVGDQVILVDDSGVPKKKEALFHLEKKPNGHIALRGHHGKYISLHHGKPAFKHAHHHDEIWFEALPANTSQ